MRVKKSIINSSVNIISFIIVFIPNLIVRKIFLDTLGEDILGLSSLYANIVGWLSIVEMGVGTAIIFSLYKPFAENNKKKIRAFIRFYGKFYKTTGFIILALGIVICPFLNFFIEGEIDTKLAMLGFILFLINTFISYLFSHRICILNVAQEAYIVTIATTISKLAITILQIVFLYVYPSFLLYISIQIIVNLIYFIAINMYIKKRHPWLDSDKNELEDSEKKSLLKNVRALFMHKIGSLIVFSTDSLVISKFIGLGALTRYTNYQMVISAFQQIITTGINGITASVGNLLTDGDTKKAYDIHKKVFFLNFWIASFIVISLFNTLDQFIGLWVGKEHIIDKLTYVVLMINLYFTLMRGSVGSFQEGSGNFYQDRYAPICEGAINLVASLILVKYIGLPGVFIGTLISNFTVIFWTKPYVVYKYVFNTKLANYFVMYFKYLFIALIPLMITHFATINIKTTNNIGDFIINCIINVVVINVFYIIVFFKSNEFRYYFDIVKKVIKRKSN